MSRLRSSLVFVFGVSLRGGDALSCSCVSGAVFSILDLFLGVSFTYSYSIDLVHNMCPNITCTLEKALLFIDLNLWAFGSLGYSLKISYYSYIFGSFMCGSDSFRQHAQQCSWECQHAPYMQFNNHYTPSTQSYKWNNTIMVAYILLTVYSGSHGWLNKKEGKTYYKWSLPRHGTSIQAQSRHSLFT